MTEEVEKPLDGLSEEEKATIIKNAVKDIDVQDILVCGKCNEVYHILEEFKEHKESESCVENGELMETLKDDKKPQIWAFTLWKNTKFKKIASDEKAPTSWNIYQTWRSMKPEEKQTWLTVAANMQGLFDIVTNFERNKLKIVPKVEETKQAPVILNKVVKTSNTRRAFRTGTEPKLEHLVEKIISKRYNPRRKTFEYLVKWETLDSEKNSWEAAAALNNCKSMMEEFEKHHQAQREQNRAQKSLDKAKKAAERPPYSEGRPQRTSKQKAVSQVKAWCGAEFQDHGDKRVYSDDSDDDESYEKRIKMEPEDSESDDGQPVVTIKRVTKNGIERRVGSAQKVDTITLPENILIPDSKGIVRISQKQIPSLSSGVYVMSKTAGIIKLDTAAASKLTQGGGQTVLKVAPKVGQSSIKIVKKSSLDMNNGSKAGSKMAAQAKPVMKNYSGKVYMQRRTNAQSAAAVAAQVKKNEVDFDRDLNKYDDESDGVEEMEFPEVIQIPTADSPPPEFSLCPLTGKVVDKNGTVLECEEPEAPENDAQTDETKNIECVTVKMEQHSPVTTSINTTTSSSLGNLVSIAAADILDDLTNNEKSDTSNESLTLQASMDLATSTPVSIQSSVSSPPPLVPATPSPRNVMQLQQVRATQASTTSPSILSTALTNANIVRRGPPKLVRRMVAGGLVQTRPPPHQIVRQIGQGGQTVVTRVVTSGGTTQQVRQVRPAGTVIRKRIVQVPAGGGQPRSVVRQQRVYQQVVKTSPQVTQVTYVATPTHTNKVISMPPLVETIMAPTQVVQKEKPIAPKVQHHVQHVQQVQQVQTVAQPVVQQIVQQEVPTTSAACVQEAPTLSLTDSDTPLLITGEDGTIYQVAGQNEEGQTVLITQGEDGEQQCLLVAPENASLITQALAKPAQTQEPIVQQHAIVQEEQPQVSVEQQLSINTAVEQAVEEAADDSQVVAQIVSANPPSPGGTRKVVLMLPDGNFMMTEVTAEQYAALELDK